MISRDGTPSTPCLFKGSPTLKFEIHLSKPTDDEANAIRTAIAASDVTVAVLTDSGLTVIRNEGMSCYVLKQTWVTITAVLVFTNCGGGALNTF